MGFNSGFKGLIHNTSGWLPSRNNTSPSSHGNFINSFFFKRNRFLNADKNKLFKISLSCFETVCTYTFYYILMYLFDVFQLLCHGLKMTGGQGPNYYNINKTIYTWVDIDCEYLWILFQLVCLLYQFQYINILGAVNAQKFLSFLRSALLPIFFVHGRTR